MLFTLPALVHTLFAPVNALRKKSVLRRSTDLVNFIQNPLSETDIAILSGNYLRFFTYHRWHFAVFYPIFRQWGYFKCRLGYQDFKDQICQGHDKLSRVYHSLFFWKVAYSKWNFKKQTIPIVIKSYVIINVRQYSTDIYRLKTKFDLT